MSQNKDIGPLKNNRLFSGIDASKLKMKIRQNNFHSFIEGDVIYQKGDGSENIYLIIDGEVKLKIHSTDSGQNIFRKGKNDFFGELELFEKTPRNSSAVANTECILYSLTRQELYELISSDKKINKNIKGEVEDEPAGIEEPVINDEMGFDNTGTDTANTDGSSLTDDEPLQITPDEESEINFFEDEPKIENDFFTPSAEPDEAVPVINDEPGKIDDEIAAGEEDFDLLKLENEIEEEEIEQGIFSEALDGDLEIGEEPLQTMVPEFNEGTQDFSNDLITNYIQDESPVKTPADTDPVHDYKKLSNVLRKIYSGAGLENSVRAIIEALFELIEPQIIRIFICEKSSGDLWAYPFMDNSGEIKHVRSGEGLIGCSAAGKEVINLNEPLSDSRFNSSVDAVENILIEDMLLYPVIDESKNLAAVIQMINSGKYGFSAGDIETLNFISPDISSVILKPEAATAAEEKPSHQDKAAEEELQKTEEFYFNKASEFLNGNLRISLSLAKRFVDFIKKKGGSQEIAHAAELAGNQIDSTIKFTNEVVDFFNGRTALKKEIISIRQALDEILEQLAEFVESKNAKLFKKCSADALVNIDKSALYHACFQIVKNACEAMPEGGNIYITCSLEEKNILIEIRDTGKGFDTEAMDKLFEPFFSYPENKNPGLGLAIASKIVKDHGGELKAGPVSIEGAAFFISLLSAE